jgi:hypothetical protein
MVRLAGRPLMPREGRALSTRVLADRRRRPLHILVVEKIVTKPRTLPRLLVALPLALVVGFVGMVSTSIIGWYWTSMLRRLTVSWGTSGR